MRSDVYALACVAYACLTGRPPFTGVTDVQTAQGHLSEPVPDARAPAAILLWEYPQRALQVVAVRRDRGPEGLADDSRALFDGWTTAVRSEPT